MKGIRFFFLLLISIESCSKHDSIDMFPEPEFSVRTINNKNYVIDTLYLDSVLNTTFDGNIGVYKDKIYFIDKLFCTINFFDTTGMLTLTTLGHGRGPMETTIGQIYTHVFLDDGSLCLQGVSDDVHIFNTRFEFELDKSYRKRRIRYNIGDKIGYDQFELYSMGYPLVCRSYKKSVFTNNRSEDPTFNYFYTPNIFVEEFRNITEQRLDKKATGRLLGKGMPESYRGTSKTHYIFSSTFFDIDRNGNFYVTYMADSLIYVYDKDYLPKYSFGFEGVSMDKDYIPIIDVNDIHTIGIAQYNTKGFYTWLEYIDELDLLLRSYSKGKHELVDGLQIYNGRTLVGDINVPKGFKPIGYIEPYIYSDAFVDDDKWNIFVCRIKVK